MHIFIYGYGLGKRIRTSGLLNPIQARYQTAPYPVDAIYITIFFRACQCFYALIFLFVKKKFLLFVSAFFVPNLWFPFMFLPLFCRFCGFTFLSDNRRDKISDQKHRYVCNNDRRAYGGIDDAGKQQSDYRRSR